MEKLLKWSIDAAKSDGSTPVAAPDPKVLNQLFGGKDEATMMVESLAKVYDKKNFNHEQRMIAFDDLEMLVESLDNANNLGPLKMWAPLIELLDEYKQIPKDTQETKESKETEEPKEESKDAEESEKPEEKKEDAIEISKMAAWVIGTATQNNEKAQDQALDTEDGVVIKKLIETATASSQNNDTTTQSPAESKALVELSVKALYALASVLGHNARAYELFCKNNGWALFTQLLVPSSKSSKPVDEKVKQRAFGLLRVLVTSETTEADVRHSHVSGFNVLNNVVSDDHIGKDSNANTRDRALGFLEALHSTEYKFSPKEKQDIKKLVDDLKNEGILEKDEYNMF